jgi:hypothetical protein
VLILVLGVALALLWRFPSLASPGATPIEPSDFSPNAITINFDDLPPVPGLVVTDQYRPVGAIFENGQISQPWYAPSPPNAFGPALDPTQPYRVRFVDPSTLTPTMTISVGLVVDLDLFWSQNAPLRAYDLDGNLLRVEYFTGAGDFAGLTSPEGIAWIEFGPSDGYDNLMFEPVAPITPTPTPTPPSAVGGIVELAVGQPDSPASPPEGSRSSAPPYAALTGGLAAAALALTAGPWYARRRWVR